MQVQSTLMTKLGVRALQKCKNSGRFLKGKILFTSLFFVLSFFSCKSTPKIEPVDILNLIDGDAPFLIYIPANSNQKFVEYAMVKMAGMKEGDAKTIASRSKNIAISTNSDGEFQIALEGSYPKIGLNIALAEKKGWKQSLSTQTALPMEYYSSEQFGIQVASPESSVLFVAANVAPILKRYVSEQRRLILKAEEIQDSEDSKVLSDEIYNFLKDNDGKEIHFYSQNPAAFVKNFLGKVVSLGLVTLSGSLVESNADKTFALKLDLTLSSSAVAKASVKMLKLALFPIPAKIVQTGETSVQITDISLTYNQLLNLIK